MDPARWARGVSREVPAFPAAQGAKPQAGPSGVCLQVEREIALHSSLRHRHIVALHGHFADSDHVYLVLEYCSHQVPGAGQGEPGVPISYLPERCALPSLTNSPLCQAPLIVRPTNTPLGPPRSCKQPGSIQSPREPPFLPVPTCVPLLPSVMPTWPR